MTDHAPIFHLSDRARRRLLRANVAAAIGLGLAIFAMANVLSERHYERFNWSRRPFARLSDASRRQLEAVAQDIRFIALLRPDHEAYRATKALLREYAAQAPHVAVEFVDPDGDRARTEQLVAQYGWTGGEGVAVAIGGRHQIVPAADLVEYAAAADPDDPPRRTFRGEALFGRAIQGLTQAARPVACFLQGHGERAPDDFDRHAGYSRIAAHLRAANLDVERLDLGEAKTVPNRCAVLIVAGPTKEFAPFEIALLRDYLNRKGRLLLLLDARTATGLEPPATPSPAPTNRSSPRWPAVRRRAGRSSTRTIRPRISIRGWTCPGRCPWRSPSSAARCRASTSRSGPPGSWSSAIPISPPTAGSWAPTPTSSSTPCAGCWKARAASPPRPPRSRNSASCSTRGSCGISSGSRAASSRAASPCSVSGPSGAGGAER